MGVVVGGGGEGLDEVEDDGALGEGEVAVPGEVEADVALEEGTLVVLENHGCLRNQCQHVAERRGYGCGCGCRSVWGMR